MNLNNREIRKLAQVHIDNGLNRQETIGIIKNEMSNPPSEIAKILRYMATITEKNQFQVLKVILISILSISALGAMALAITMIAENGLGFLPFLFIFPAFSIIFIVMIVMNRGRVYQTIIILSAIGIMQSFKYLGNEDDGMSILIGIGLNVVMIIVAAIAHFKLTKSFSVIKKRVELENNQVKIEEVIIFEE